MDLHSILYSINSHVYFRCVEAGISSHTSQLASSRCNPPPSLPFYLSKNKSVIYDICCNSVIFMECRIFLESNCYEIIIIY